MNGTFKSAAHRIGQIYAIHICQKGNWIPVVVNLMTHKTKNSYIKLLTVLKEEVLARLNKHLTPEYISTGYEQAAIGAIGNVFPNTRITGCLFHFGQALWRKLQSDGLASMYTEEANEEFRAESVSYTHLTLPTNREV